jgi:methylmalonyl-CoA mutase C-terminal domain/subunit
MAAKQHRILLGKLGEGHKEALLNLAKALSEAGFEVVYTELQDPEAIVKSALQECVDHIGITTLPGARIEAFEEMIGQLRERQADHISIAAGGFMDDEDIPRIKEMGVMAFFPRGTTFREIVEWAQEQTHIRTC